MYKHRRSITLGIFVVLVLLILVNQGPTPIVQSLMLPMPDHTRLAADIIRPATTEKSPTIVIQTRYWRSFALKIPVTPPIPIGPREEIVEPLLKAGFAVVIVDVRGTGASEGTWEYPWSEAEIKDAGGIMDWIIAQPWSDGTIGTYGVSYEGTTALLAATLHHPAHKAALAREIEWNLADELLFPGDVKNIAFATAWGDSVGDLDRGRYPALFPESARYIVKGVRPTEDDPKGVGLAGRLASRSVADVGGDVAGMMDRKSRFGSDGPLLEELGPAAFRERLSTATAVLGLWGGWWDGATAAGVMEAGREVGLVEAVIGPWNHEGTEGVSPYVHSKSERSTVDLQDVVGFFQRHLRGQGERGARVRWFEQGSEVWREGEGWPETRKVRLSVSFSSTLEVDFSVSAGVNTRWMAGMLHPIMYPEVSLEAGYVGWDAAKVSEPWRLFGAPVLSCESERSAPVAALHGWMESVDPQGRSRILTDGVQRVTTQRVTLKFQPTAFLLDRGWSIRLRLAGADADTFARVPAEGGMI